MKNKFAVVVTYVLYVIFVALIGYAIIHIALKPQTPLSQVDIPQETIDWFEGIWKDTTDIGGRFDPTDTSDWSSYDDIDGMLCLEDEYFVIFYSAKDSVTERNKALITQRYAHEAIPLGEAFMKNYPYPSTLNGRKLPIYLANTLDDFRGICVQLGHGDPGTWAIGLYCFSFGGDKVYTDGIIISPDAWTVAESTINATTTDDELKQTLWHEMNHFMYFSNWDFTQTSQPCLWFTEGLAEYFASNYDRLSETGNYNMLNLNDDFMGGGNTEYWAGLSAYLCLEKNSDKSKVSNVVTNSYKNSVDKSVQTAISGYDLDKWNTQWHTFMKNGEYKNYQE